MLATLRERARAIVPKRLDIHTSGKLEKALSALAKIEDRRREIVAKDQAKLAAIQELLNEFQSAGGAGMRSNDVGEYKESLREWALAQAAIEPLKNMSIVAVRGSYSDPGHVEQLKLRCGDLKGPLIKVCQLRLEQAHFNLERVTREEQSRLDSLGSFDAESSPVVKHEANKVDHYKGMLSRITTEPVENIFVNFAQQLLSDE
jgi:hypothetical protein